MNTNPKNEGAIADNEHIKAITPELVYKWLLIVWCTTIDQTGGNFSITNSFRLFTLSLTSTGLGASENQARLINAHTETYRASDFLD